MTAAQKKARANFTKAIAYRKKTGCTLKQAFAHVKGIKVAATPKKVGATMLIEKGESKTKRPTKVVQIVRSKNSKTGNKKGTFKKFNVIGNLEQNQFTNLINTKKEIILLETQLASLDRELYRQHQPTEYRTITKYYAFINKEIKRTKSILAVKKRYLNQLKKLI
jgi:hypothetical protein